MYFVCSQILIILWSWKYAAMKNEKCLSRFYNNNFQSIVDKIYQVEFVLSVTWSKNYIVADNKYYTNRKRIKDRHFR